MNKLLGFGLLGVIIYSAVRFAKIKNVADSISVKLVSPKIQKVELSGITFRTDVKINNPTPDSLTLTKPVITLTSEGKVLGRSKSENQTLTIAPLSMTSMNALELQVGWTVLGTYLVGIIGKIPELIVNYKKGSIPGIVKLLGIPMEMTFSTYTNGIFFQSTPSKIM